MLLAPPCLQGRRKFFVFKLWAPTAAGAFLAAHLKTLCTFRPVRAVPLTMKERIEGGMKELENRSTLTGAASMKSIALFLLTN